MISRFFIDRPNFALVLAIVTVILGAIGIRFIPISQFPDIVPPRVSVSATYPGASAALIRDAVAAPIERELNGVDGVIHMSSSSSNDGTYKLSISFEPGTDPDIAAVHVQNRVALVTPSLPADVVQQGISTSTRSGSFLQLITLTSPNRTHDQLFLSNYASDLLQDPLGRIKGVGAANQFGPLEYSMRIWLDPKKMAALNIDASDVSAAVQSQNVETAAGQVGAPPFGDQRTSFQFTLQADGLLKTAEEFEDIIVLADGEASFVRLKDIARIELGAESYAATSRYKGEPAAVIAIYQKSGANAFDVADAVHREMGRLAARFPDDVAYELTYDVTAAVRMSIKEIVITLGITTLLVVSVTLFFLLSWRATLVPAIAIPVSLLGTFAMISLVGFSANMITLFALVLAITLVVDDAIVIIENAERIMKDHGLGARAATLKAMSQVTRPIVATTFVLAAVFVPVCFFPGAIGEIYRQFAVTITIAFALSAVNALTLGPALCSRILSRRAGAPKGVFRFIPSAIDRVRDAYVALVRLMMRFMAASILIFIAVVGATIYLFQTTPTGFIPPEDTGVLFVDVNLPDGASLQRTETVMQEISERVESHPGVVSATAVSGHSMISGNASNAGMLVLNLAPWDERTSRETRWWAIMFSLTKSLAALPEASSFVFPLPAIPGLGHSGGLSAKLLDLDGGSLADLDRVTTAFLSALREAPEFTQAFSGFSATAPQYELTIDRDRAEAMRVAVSDILAALQANFGSRYVNNFIKDGRIYAVTMSADAPFRQTADDIEGLFVKNADGEALPLWTFVDLTPNLGARKISRYNLFTAASISAQLARGVSSGAAIAKMREIAEATLPDGYVIEWSDVTSEEVEAGKLIVPILILAITFAYLFLVAQYESWLLPLSVMASTVFAIFGALLPLQIIPFLSNNMYAQIGIVLMIGLAAKKAIMVVEFAKAAREDGLSIQEAAIAAAHQRFRPVTMTGLCFIFGVLPLLLASGAGAAGRMSIGFPVFAGMVIDSTLGLLMIPVLYAACQTLSERLGRLRRGGKALEGSA